MDRSRMLRAAASMSIVLLASAAGPVVADIVPGTWEFEILAGLYDPEPDLLDADPVIGARLVKNLTSRYAIEGEISLYDAVFDLPGFSPPPSIKYDATFVELTGVVHFRPSKRFVPAVLGGIGGAFISASIPGDEGLLVPAAGLGDDSFTVHSGAAAKIRLTTKLYLRPDVRARLLDAREFDKVDLQITLAVGFGTVGW